MIPMELRHKRKYYNVIVQQFQGNLPSLTNSPTPSNGKIEMDVRPAHMFSCYFPEAFSGQNSPTTLTYDQNIKWA